MKVWVGVVLLVLALLFGTGGVHYHNQLVAFDVAAETQWKQVENQLARQHELLPKLAQVATRYVEHEREVLEALFASREQYLAAPAAQRPRMAGEVDAVLVDVLALAERYPDLKADQHYRDLSYEIAGTKNRIAVERMRYNEVVGRLNTRLRQLPWLLAAWDIEPRDFYEAEEGSLVEPELAL